MRSINISVSQKSVPLLLAALVAGAGLLPAVTGAPLVDASLGFAHSADFDADESGWTASEVLPAQRPQHTGVWEWGTPTSGPGAAASGSHVWATRLAGPYGARECGAILSPPIDLTGATSASASIREWHHTQQLTSGSRFVNDAGLLLVTADGGGTFSVAHPDVAYAGPLGSVVRPCLDGQLSGAQGIGGPAGATPPPATYATMTIDLAPFVGQVVQVALAFGSDCCTHYAGWYVDDFALTIDGATTVEDFEEGDGGFTQVTPYAIPQPEREGWERGTPAEGPAAATPLFATNVDGHYGHDECAWLESPPIDLGPAGDLGVARATLTWSQWFRSNSIYAAGVVQVGTPDGYVTLEPEGGYPGTTSGSVQDKLLACLGVDAAQRAYSGLHNTLGAPLAPQRADLTPWLGSTVTVRFLFASAWSNLNPTTQHGWYVDDVAVETRLFVDDPGAEALVGEAVGRTPLSGRVMPPGWTHGGRESTWSWGVATSGPAGETTLATNLTGSHAGAECSWVETPSVPGALLAGNPTLTFDHWYDIYPASTSGAAWSGGVVMVSVDEGATWRYLDLPEYTLDARYSGTRGCIASLDPTTSGTLYPRVFSGDHRFFETVSVDLSEFADAQTVKVRFVFSSGIGIYRDGWYLRGVDLAGVGVL